MAIQFCNVCGDTLPISRKLEVKCDCCGEINKNTLLNAISVSTANDFPSELRQNRGPVNKAKLASTDTWARTDVECPKCHAKEVQYTALQLRSADEGTTMFYACPACSERWNEDN